MFDIEIKYGNSEVKLTFMDISPDEYAQVYGAVCDLSFTVAGEYIGQKTEEERMRAALDAFRIIGEEIRQVNERNVAMETETQDAIEALGPYADEDRSLADCIKKVVNENITMQNQAIGAYELREKTENRIKTLEEDNGSLNRNITSTMEELASAKRTIEGVRIAMGLTSEAIPSSVLPDTVAATLSDLRRTTAAVGRERQEIQEELERTHKEVVSLRIDAANTLRLVSDGHSRKPTEALDVLVAGAIERAFHKGRKTGSAFTLNGQATGEYATLCELVTQGAITMRLLRRLVFLVDDIQDAQGDVLDSIKTYLVSQGQLSSDVASV